MIVKGVENNREAVVAFQGVVPPQFGGPNLGGLAVQEFNTDVEEGIIIHNAHLCLFRRNFAFDRLLLVELRQGRRHLPYTASSSRPSMEGGLIDSPGHHGRRCFRARG